MTKPELPPKVLRELWSALPPDGDRRAMELHVASRRVFATMWEQSERALEVYARIAKKFPRATVVVHKRLGALSWQLRVLEVHRKSKFVPESVDAEILRLARLCVDEVPKRFKANSPFGATCIEAWYRGNLALARETGFGKSAQLKQFVRAMESYQRSPRTHMEGQLKSTSRVKVLFELGRKAPWFR